MFFVPYFLCSSVLCSNVSYSTVLCSNVLCSNVLCSNVLCVSVLYSNVVNNNDDDEFLSSPNFNLERSKPKINMVKVPTGCSYKVSLI